MLNVNQKIDDLGVFGTPYAVADNFVAKEDGFLNLYINPPTTKPSFVRLTIGNRYSVGNGNINGQQYNIFACVKKDDKVISYGTNASDQIWTFIPLSSKWSFMRLFNPFTIFFTRMVFVLC